MDHDAESINSIVLPLMNVPRPMKNGVINPFEPQQCQFWMTSAGVRNSFAYDKLIEMLGFTILNPRRYSVIGCSYKVPLLAGVLSKDYLNEIKSSKTFSEASFAAEYLSLWQGTTKDSWVSFDKIARHRTLVNPEKAEKLTNDSKSFYIFSVDVARIGCQTVCTPIKVNPRDDGFKASLPNCFVLGKTDESKRFEIQALHLKRLIRDFNPREVVIDTNGLGVGLADEMIKPTFDSETNTFLPAYGFQNDELYKKIQPRDAPEILISFKATKEINSKMYSKLYTIIESGRLKFLISELDAKTKLLSTKVGQSMSSENRVKRLMPHEMTSQLINEILNMKHKPTSTLERLEIEQINKRKTKDKFSALSMGIYRMTQLEEIHMNKRRNRGLGRENLFLFTSNNSRKKRK